MSELIENLKSRREQRRLYNKYNREYEKICELMSEYQEVCDISENVLNGHEHFRIKEIEDEIIDIIDENEGVLLIQGEFDQNLGMKALCFGLKRVTLRALDNEEASLQPDDRGYILGQFCVNFDFEEGVIKALDNPKASTYIYKGNNFMNYNPLFFLSGWGKNLGMMAIENGMKKATLKALDNFEASCQTNPKGQNIGMICAEEFFEEGVLKALDNPVASVQQDEDGRNIGMLSALYGLEKGTVKALDNDVASHQKSIYDNTIYDYCFQHSLYQAIDKYNNLYGQNANSSNFSNIQVGDNRATVDKDENLEFEKVENTQSAGVIDDIGQKDMSYNVVTIENNFNENNFETFLSDFNENDLDVSEM